MKMNCQTHIETEPVDELTKIIDSLLSKEQGYQSEIAILKEQIRSLQARLFGRKSEKRVVDDGQLFLFESPEEFFTPVAVPEQVDEIAIGAHKRKKGGRQSIPDNLPRIEIIHDLSDAEKQCQCGCTKICIGQESSEQLDIIPAKIQVIRNIRLKYACKSCEGVDDNRATVMIARMPDQIIPKCIGTPGLIAFVLVAKFVDHIPFYRQEKQFLRIGVDISRATMCNWARKIGESFEILLMMLKKEVIAGKLINIDETPVQVLNEPGKSNQSKSYMWIFRGGTPEAPGIIFEYRPSRAGDVAADFIKGYEGVIQTDGYKGYDFIDHIKEILHMGCFAHVRRKFVAVEKAAGKPADATRQTITGQALKYIRKLYEIERQAKEKGLTGVELLRERHEKAATVMDDLKKLLDTSLNNVPPQSLLGKAINYALNQWHRLVVYLKTPYVTLDNNLVENAIRPFAIGRKNWLFSGTPEGAAASAAIYSIIETAKANGLEPYWYLRYLLERLPDAMTEDDFKALLPQHIQPSQLNGQLNLS